MAGKATDLCRYGATTFTLNYITQAIAACFWPLILCFGPACHFHDNKTVRQLAFQFEMIF